MIYKPGEISLENDLDLVPWERGVRQKGGLMNIETMSKNLLDFKETMDKFGVPFVLVFGTLLWYMREHDFKVHDADVDVACFNEFIRKDHWKLKNIKEDLRNKEFKVIGNDECYLHIDFFIRNGEKIEIWWFDKIDNEWIFGDTCRYSAHFFDKLEEINLLGTTFKIPSYPEKMLKITYGKDWRIPNPKGHWLNLNPKEIEKREK